MEELKIKHRIVHNNLQDLINKEKLENIPTDATDSDAFDFGIFNPYDEIFSFVTELARHYADRIKMETIGKSYEHRPIYSLKIGANDASDKPVIILECGIHAREWISVSACTYLVDQLVENYDRDITIKALVDKYEFNVVLVSNPDGYIYTWTTDRMWRKSRSHSLYNWPKSCRGADINRNFDYEHCGIGASIDPCQENYCGDAPFSEPEAQALRDLMLSKRGRTTAYISIHSYSQLWMVPYGDKADLPPNYKEMERIANIGIQALKKPYNTEYKFGSIFNALYPVTGSSIDYAYAEQVTALAYTLELRDNGTYGFLLPKKDILPTCIETYEGLIAAIKEFD